MSGLISAATGLHSSSPPRRSSTATHSRGTTFAAAVQQHRPRRRAAFLSPRRSSAVMFPCGYPCRELMSVAATGLRSPSPPNIRSDMSRPSALGTDRRGRLSVSSAAAGDATPSPSLVRGDVPPHPTAQGANLSDCPSAAFAKRTSVPPPRRTSAATHIPRPSARDAYLCGRVRGGGPPLPLPADCPQRMSVIVCCVLTVVSTPFST